MREPSLSVIIPVRDGGAPFAACLTALVRGPAPLPELIVVDDGSRDDSRARAAAAGAVVLATGGAQGPGAARNLGARWARGDWLLFLDADCEVHPDTLAIAAAAAAEPDLVAFFGSYDAAPAAPGFVSQYKNLFHHYVHQQGRDEATTFWAGCGAVRRSAFEAVDGFDARNYPRPSIEDIELGYRLRAAGGRIRLVKALQVRHHKRWTLGGLIRSDVVDRGIPWTALLLAGRGPGGDLNLRPRDRASVAAVWALAGLLSLAPWRPGLLALALLPAVALLAAHRDLYRFFRRHRGTGFAVGAVPLHWFYLWYCGVAFAGGAWRYLADRVVSPR
ncbi:MAG: glycosyltransferase family 2 protein [Gemmatimonadota bacterium]